jgi:condensin complex subunit 3
LIVDLFFYKGSTKKKTNRKKSDDKGKQGRKEKDGDVVMEDAGEDGDENEVEREEFVETEATHAVLRILHHLVPLSKSRTKWVRYRTAQFLALLLSNTFSTFPFDYSHISLTIFLNIRNALLDRIQDKESIVRVQAVIGLVRLMEMGVSVSSDAEDESVTAEPQDKVEKVLIETMQSDPSAYKVSHRGIFLC